MATLEKLYLSVMSGTHDSNIKFRELQRLLDALGFEYRTRGDHFIYSYRTLSENINIQPRGNMAKPYQVKQLRNFLLKYRITVEK